MHQGILYGSFFGFSTPNRSDKNCLSQCQSYFQNIGLLLLYHCSRCQTRLDSVGNKSVLSRLLCYLSISAFSGFSICLFGKGILNDYNIASNRGYARNPYTAVCFFLSIPFRCLTQCRSRQRTVCNQLLHIQKSVQKVGSVQP